MKIITTTNQYKNDIFNKLAFDFEPSRKILDLGCGDGTDAVILRDEYKLDVYGVDVYRHDNIDKFNINFVEASIFNIPFEDNFFDYIFMHDVLHHIDEKTQRYCQHLAGLKEVERVVKVGGNIIIVEGNRYNPLFYPHMVKMLGHEHWKQSYFKKVIKDAFEGKTIKFSFFEAHFYPSLLLFWKLYEGLMEKLSPKKFLAYNVAVIKK